MSQASWPNLNNFLKPCLELSGARLRSLISDCITNRLAGLGAGLALGLTYAALLISAAAAEMRDEWIDPDTGHLVVRLSRVPGESQSLYFHQNEFTASGDKLV